MRYLLLALFVALGGCGATSKPVVFVPPAPLPLAIQTNPQIALVYSEMRITCRLPADVGDGVYYFGVSGMTASEGPIDRRVYERMIRVPCETLHIYCGYSEQIPNVGLSKPKTVTQDMEPVGECR